jgi:lipopolysaccharide/colanic/teichoic acid biosynthesis glycosyltransferase
MIEINGQEARSVWRLDPGRASADPAATVPAQRWYQPLKIIGDFLFALVLLVLTAPLLLLGAVLVKLTSRGPVLYTQIRLGYLGQPFTIYKLRTMRHNCEAVSGPRWSGPGDARITPIGRLLRRTHIDELPQLWNVLCGHMSLVGPRPERPEFTPELERALPCYRDRLLLRPGITGLAQVQLPPDTDLASVRRKLAHDLYYFRMLGPWLDVRILLATGFRFAGIPWSISRRFFLLPGGEQVESAYESATGLPAPELQPV